MSTAKKVVLTLLSLLALLLLYFAISIGAFKLYERAASPSGLTNITDFLRQRGEPAFAKQFMIDGRTFYELTFPQTLYTSLLEIIALPSHRPAHLFDEHGQLIDWSLDPQDGTLYRTRYPSKAATPIPFDQLRQHLPK